MNEESRTRTSHFFRSLLWFCSGANRDILEACPSSEHNKYAGIGATVLFTGLLAAFSGGYALYTAFESVPLAAGFGLFWGLLIFNLDRFIVSTIKKDGGLRHQLKMALPRFLLAIVLAVVISKPLELKIFESEILEILQRRQLDQLADAEANFQHKFGEKQAAIADLKAEINEKYRVREQDYQDYKCECDGTCGTGQVGRGPECARKEAKYEQSQREYLETKANNEVAIQAIQADIGTLETQLAEQQEKLEGAFSTGLVARLSASSELPVGPSVFIMLLILLVETSPILAKILSSRGPYDELLRKIEERFYLDQLEELNRRKLELTRQVNLTSSLNQAQIDQQVRQRRQTLQAITDAQMKVVKEQIEVWLAEEKGKR